MSEEVESLERELRGVQEMLALVLDEIGHPVEITKESIKRGLPNGAQIKIDEHLERDSFIFSLEVGE